MKEFAKSEKVRDLGEALDIIKNFCQNHNKTVAVAESVFSGNPQLLFSSKEEAGLFFQGGITTIIASKKPDIWKSRRKPAIPILGFPTKSPVGWPSKPANFSTPN